MHELYNLRVLNDYINQTIDVLLRAQRLGGQVPGITHSPYAAHASVFGAPVGFGVGVGVDPTLAGLSHSPYAAPFTNPFGAPFTAPMTTPFPGTIGASPFAQGVIDPLLSRGLSHSPFAANAWQPWSPITEIVRQQQLAQAIAARQSVIEAMYRTAGIPV